MGKSSNSAKTSIFTPKKTVGFFFVSLIGNIVAGLIIWPILDLFWCGVITRSPFEYSVMEHVVWPIVIMVILTIIEFIFFDSIYKNKKK